MPPLEALLGLVCFAWVLHDVFNTVILPRPSPARYRPAGLLTRWGWRVWRRYADRSRTPEQREGRLGIFAPAIVMLLLGVWIVLLITGFALLMHALADQIRPPLPDLGTALYFAAISLLTIGYGDFVPVGAVARAVSVAAGGVGLGIVALTITYLFSLYGSFQRRELLVVTLDARAGAPPSGVVLLETCARYHQAEELRRRFADWERWSAAVLESHLAYPILLFFRSTHDHESWVSAIGAELDASTLVLTTIQDRPAGAAWVMHDIGPTSWRTSRASSATPPPRRPGSNARNSTTPGGVWPRADTCCCRTPTRPGPRSRSAAAPMPDGSTAWRIFSRSRRPNGSATGARSGTSEVPR